MAELDFSFCSMADYEAGQKDIVLEQHLITGEPYNLMLALAEGGPNEAAIIPARILRVASRRRAHSVKFVALDEDFNTTLEAEFPIQDGYMHPEQMIIEATGQFVVAAYFKGYDGDMPSLDVLQEDIKAHSGV